MEVRCILLFVAFLLSFFLHCSAVDTIIANQSLSDGETLVSAGGSFELGFFSPSGIKNRYLAMWYLNIASETVVWVANREAPLNDSNGALKVTREGLLVILNGADEIIWSANSFGVNTGNPVAELLDSGNLVLKDGNDNNPDNYLWQSFDHPSETLLPGMRLGINRLKNKDIYLSSWKRSDDPAQGDFKFQIDSNGYPQKYVTNGSILKFRLGPWTGLGFSGMPNLKPNPFFTYKFVFNQDETYYAYELVNRSVVTRLVLNPSGDVQRFVWINRTHSWLLYTNTQADNCDSYALCGAYGSCNIGNSPACGCLKGFEPKSQREWALADWSNGCVRKTQLDCGEAVGYLMYSNVKLPDTRNSWFDHSVNLAECKDLCSQNCSCSAYANMDIRNGGSGCFLWFNRLLDMREYTRDAQVLYVKMATSELGQFAEKNQRGRTIAISVCIVVVLVLSIGLAWCIWRNKERMINRTGKLGTIFNLVFGKESGEFMLARFDLTVIANATGNFSPVNILGKGGFGIVYKGVLDDGKEIAVKRLLPNAQQGNDEFRNEVNYIAMLQHKNLIKLLGYSLQGEERLLIYEYMQNGSLDFYIFNEERSRLLDWPTRLRILKGIAGGLQYLHQDSRVIIIHRDIKAANILVDKDMNPKIADFGIARSFEANQTVAATSRIVGTPGYISPEYFQEGLFSFQSDVFSFGILLLEIVSGKRNPQLTDQQNRRDLVRKAWELFQLGETADLMGESLLSSSDSIEVVRAVHVGLLCVQQRPEDRPDMRKILRVLEGDLCDLAQPEEPVPYAGSNPLLGAALGVNEVTINEVTITEVVGR